MCRIYRTVGRSRYYLSKWNYWTQWEWLAQLLPPAQAAQRAQQENAEVERLCGSHRIYPDLQL